MKFVRTTFATASLAAVASCGVHTEALPEDNVLREGKGFSHTVSTDVLNWFDNEAGHTRLLRSSLKTCGLPQNTDPTSIRFERIFAAYGHRMYAFDCKDSGKVFQ